MKGGGGGAETVARPKFLRKKCEKITFISKVSVHTSQILRIKDQPVIKKEKKNLLILLRDV